MSTTDTRTAHRCEACEAAHIDAPAVHDFGQHVRLVGTPVPVRYACARHVAGTKAATVRNLDPILPGEVVRVVRTGGMAESATRYRVTFSIGGVLRGVLLDRNGAEVTGERVALTRRNPRTGRMGPLPHRRIVRLPLPAEAR